MRIKLKDVEDRVLLSDVLLRMGQKDISTSENELSMDLSNLSEEFIEQLQELTPETLRELSEVKDIQLEKDLEEQLKIEEKKTHLTKIIENENLKQDLRDKAAETLAELEK